DRWLLKKLVGDRKQPDVLLAVKEPKTKSDRDLQKIVCVGRFDKAHGFFDAIWAHDVMSHFMPKLKIDLIGGAPELHQLQSFVHHISHHAENVRFLPPNQDALEHLSEATMVWVPSHSAAGEQVALEAQVAGAPVIATRIPSLATMIADGETGMLVPTNDP